MALTPPPLNDVEGTFVFKDWLNKLYQYLGSSTGLIPWDQIDKAGSNLSDLAVKNHSSLNALEGAGPEYIHLNQDEYDSIFDGGGSWSGEIDTTDDIIIDSTTSGLVLLDTAGHYWRITISTSGELTSTDLGLTKP